MKRKQKVGLATGVATLALVAGVGFAGTTFTAPGLSMNNVSIGTSTVDDASYKLNDDLQNKKITINDKEFTYDELGVSYNSDDIATALENSKVINFESWNTSQNTAVKIDEDKLMKTVQEKLPEDFKKPVNADVKLNDSGTSWTVVKGKDGAVPVVKDIQKLIDEDLKNGSDKVPSYTLKTVKPGVTNAMAEKEAKKLNKLADEAGFYDAKNEKLSISPEEFNKLIKVERTDKGFTMTADKSKVSSLVSTVPDKVNTKADNGKAVVDENGKVLKTLDEWHDGYKFTNVDGVADNMVAQLNKGDSSKVELDGKTTKAKIDERFRKVEVDLSARKAKTYENGKLVKTYPIAIGKPGTETDKGNFHVFFQTQKQNMGCTAAYDYCTKDVPWISYYNGGEAFHGVWWHNDFGNPAASARSHGCVNMRISDAKEMYRFVQSGTPVHVF